MHTLNSSTSLQLCELEGVEPMVSSTEAPNTEEAGSEGSHLLLAVEQRRNYDSLQYDFFPVPLLVHLSTAPIA